MMFNKIMLFLILLSFFTFSQAKSEELIKINEALTVDITEHGFNILGEGAKTFLNNEGKERTLPDQQIKVPLISRLSITGLSFKSNVDSLSFVPYNSGLKFSMVIKNFKIKVERIGIGRRGNNCEETEIILGNKNDLPIKGDFGINFSNDRFNLNINSFDFHIKRKQFSVHGPKRCYGSSGRRSRLEAFAINRLITFVRPFIHTVIKHQLRLVASKAEKMINDAAKFTLPISIPKFEIIPATTISLSAHPYDFSLNSEGLKIKLSIAILRNEHLEKNLAPRNNPIVLGERIGTVGVNPLLVNEIMRAFFINGSLPFEISKNINPDIESLFSRKELATYWPDLAQVKADSDEMKFKMKLQKTPYINITWDEGKIHVDLQQFLITTRILQNTVWRDHFDLTIDLKATIQANIKNGKIMIKLTEPETKVEGQWAKGYTPTIPEFDKNKLKELIDSFISLIENTDSSTPIEFKTPIIPIGPYKVTLNNLELKKPFIFLDINSVVQ
ncbi:MAG: hypothetical protein HQK51_06550 [Oligoflexia bacterium]|nr:hypothetical protein [Oligoflexia bacterium]